MNRTATLRTVAKRAGLALGAVLTTAAVSLTLSPSTSYAAEPTMCLDAGNSRQNGNPVVIWQCAVPGDSFTPNQQWVIDGGQIKVADTAGTARPMCLDAGNTRNNSDNVRLWQCLSPIHANQKFVIEHGQIMVADTLGTSRPMCLDITSTRNNGDRAIIYQCASSYESYMYNQRFLIEHSMIKVADTMH
ncbi:RICIN domain-containing protein [Nonomuraea sp. NPDC050733]